MFQKFVDMFDEPKVQEKPQEQIQLVKLKVISENDLDFQNNIIEERDREIRVISKQMQEVNNIMKSVAQLVDEQGDVVDTIRNNIKNSEVDVAKGKKSLEEAEESQKTGNKIALGVLIATTITVLTGGLIVIVI